MNEHGSGRHVHMAAKTSRGGKERKNKSYKGSEKVRQRGHGVERGVRKVKKHTLRGAEEDDEGGKWWMSGGLA